MTPASFISGNAMLRKFVRGVAAAHSRSLSIKQASWSDGGLSYPIDLTHTLEDEKRYYRPVGADGIPMSVWASRPVYSPTRVAEFALAHINVVAQRACPQSRRIFLETAEWFMREPQAIWWYEFDTTRLRAPWISAMAQGQGISVLVRAYRLTGREAYCDQAARAIVPLCKDIRDGGVRSMLYDGPFVEEWPLNPPTHTLNGFLYALIGLIDLAEHRPETAEQTDLMRLGKTLDDNLHRYDLGYWSAYDLSKVFQIKNPSSSRYHELHIIQLRSIGARLNKPNLVAVSSQWEDYHSSLVCQYRALATKSIYRALVRGERL